MHRFFSKPETLLRLRHGPFGEYLDRYADWLSAQGFCRAAARLHLVQIADLVFGLEAGADPQRHPAHGNRLLHRSSTAKG